MSLTSSLKWSIRKRAWNFVAKRKYRSNAPKDITSIPRTGPKLQLVPLQKVFPSIPISTIHVVKQPPRDERRTSAERFMRILARLYPTCLSPMQPGRPGVAENPHTALDRAYTKGHRRTAIRTAVELALPPSQTVQTPTLPLELQALPDLGRLAVRGPYAGYLRKVPDVDDLYEWDLRELDSYTRHSDLLPPWAHVLFRADRVSRSLTPSAITCDLGTVQPADAHWHRAVCLALCAATTHTALVRHWTWTHLIGGEYFSLTTRNHLPDDHPLRHLLWPHMVGTHSSNRLATLGQLVPAGDFEAIYSLTYAGLCELVTKSGMSFTTLAFDPEQDAAQRGILNSGLDLPTLMNCRRLFEVMEAHADRYLRLYFTDETLPLDRPIQQWLEELKRLFPGGLGLPSTPLTIATLARLVARLIYLTSVHHEQVGTHLWNYQLWTHTHPVRVYRDGRRIPEDVYQRLVNNNYILNVVRAPLITDFSPLAVKEPDNPQRQARAEQSFGKFRDDLNKLQQEMEREPWAAWKLYPKDLEANINA